MKSLAPKKSLRPRSREEGLMQLKLDQAADYAGEAPATKKPMRPRSREEGLMQLKLDSIHRSDQGTTDTKRFKNGGCVMSGRGGKYKGMK